MNVFVSGFAAAESESDLSEGNKDGEKTPKEEKDAGYNNLLQTLDCLDDLELQVRAYNIYKYKYLTTYKNTVAVTSGWI